MEIRTPGFPASWFAGIEWFRPLLWGCVYSTDSRITDRWTKPSTRPTSKAYGNRSPDLPIADLVKYYLHLPRGTIKYGRPGIQIRNRRGSVFGGAHCPQTLDAGPRWAVSFPTSCEMCHTRTIGPSTLSTSQTISTLHTPDADGLVVASRCHHVRVARVPRNSVNGARMARKHLRASWTRLSGLYVHGARTITTRSRSDRMAVNAHLEQRGIMTVPDVDLRVLATTDDERLVAPGPWGVRGAQDHNVLRPSLPPTPPPLALWQCARTPGRPLTRRRQNE